MGFLGALFPVPDVVVEEAALADLNLDPAILYPEEAVAIEKAVDKRRAEFTAGRLLARLACARLGIPPSAIRQGPDRAPIWPAGLTGSITHTRTYCGVVVAESRSARGLGIDVEANTPLAEALWSRILTDRERAALALLPPDQRGRFAKLAFCAKEAAYKAQYTVSRQFLGFDAMDISLGPEPGTFHAHLNGAVGTDFPAGTVFVGRFAENADLVASGVIVV